MRISYNWLKALVPDLTASPEEVAEKFTLHSFETEVVGTVGIDENIIVAKIVKLGRHPNADRLQLATIDVGGTTLTVVCGASNIAVGDVVPYAPPGAVVAGEGKATVTLKEATIRGVKSLGMLATLRELRLGSDHSGIWHLPVDSEPGQQLAADFPADTLLEADITPNRAHDSLGHVGLARELAALLDMQVQEPETLRLAELGAGERDWGVEIVDEHLAPRYLAVLLENLTAGPSPLWLQVRLIAAGGKPINNLVDVTNYVMFEYGNPLHLFNQETVPEHRITIRPAAENEQLRTLDGEQRELDPRDIVIASGPEPIALAGIIGGEKTQVDTAMSRGLLEVGNFHAFSVQETSRRLNLRTDASIRFSKGLDPELVATAGARAVSLLQELAGATVVGQVDQYPRPSKPKVISFDPAKPSRSAGVALSEEQAERALTRLRFAVTKDKQDTPWQVRVPTDRLDIVGEHDLVEEVIRVAGVNEVAAADLKPQTPVPLPPHIYWREVVRDVLKSLGLSEVYNASFEPARFAKVAGVADKPHIIVANPPAPELSRLRVSLLPGLLANLAANREAFHRNVRRGKESSLFEIGNIYQAGEGGRVAGIVEQENLAAVLVGSVLTLDDVARVLGEKLGAKIELMPWKSEVTSKLKYRAPVVAFEINLTKLLQSASGPVQSPQTLAEIGVQRATTVQYKEILKYPAVYRDLSVTVATSVEPQQVQRVIEQAGEGMVVDVELFDVYEGAENADASPHNLPRSFAFHIAYQSGEKTLTDKEVSTQHNVIIEALKREIGAEVRI